MKKKQSRFRRCRIVRDYLSTVADARQRVVCLMLMHECDVRDICRTLHIKKEDLETIKRQIARGLRKAGIQIGDEKC